MSETIWYDLFFTLLYPIIQWSLGKVATNLAWFSPSLTHVTITFVKFHWPWMAVALSILSVLQTQYRFLHEFATVGNAKKSLPKTVQRYAQNGAPPLAPSTHTQQAKIKEFFLLCWLYGLYFIWLRMFHIKPKTTSTDINQVERCKHNRRKIIILYATKQFITA